jgi:hypothetical protein
MKHTSTPNPLTMTLRGRAQPTQATTPQDADIQTTDTSLDDNVSLRASQGSGPSNLVNININPNQNTTATAPTQRLQAEPAMHTPGHTSLSGRKRAAPTPLESARDRYAASAIEAVKPTSAAERHALLNTVDACFEPNSNRLIRQNFPRNVLQKAKKIPPNTAVFCDTLANKIAQASRQHLDDAGTEQGSEAVIREAVAETFSTLGDSFKLQEPVSLFVFDTETNRLFGDVVSLGWIRLDIKHKSDVTVECRNCVLPPNFVAYGAERIHKMSPEWVKSYHAQGNTQSAETTAKRWLEHVMASKSAIGFNLLYDLNAVKRLLHTAGVERLKVDALMAEISDKFSIDAQDFLLRIDPATRYDNHLPFAENKPSRKFAEEEYGDTFADGSPITYLPNRKLVSYAKGFLDMNTDEAHDALYDCVMTLAAYAKSVGLRNEVLAHEREFTRQSDKRLSNYNRRLTPSETLSRRINAPALNKSDDRPIYLEADSKALINNPALKSTPFIYIPTGPTIHRRHVIPKSTLATLLIPADGFSEPHTQHEAHTLYKNLLKHPQFQAAAQDRLSDIALKICEGFKRSSLTWGHYHNADLTANVSEFVKGIEQAQDKGISIRYFERDPARHLLDNLPASGDIQGSETVDPATMHKVMGAILYSFYHSLEFNQFIGSGAENIVAGRMFHALAKHEPSTLQAIEHAENTNAIASILQDWLGHIQSVLEPGASDTDPNDIETQVLSLCNPEVTKKVSADTILYFLEMRRSIQEFLEAFLKFTLPESPQPIRLTSAQEAHGIKEQAQKKLNLLLGIAQHQENANRKTFSTQDWCEPLHIIKQTLDNAETQADIEQTLQSLQAALPRALAILDGTTLYDGDKKLLTSLVLTLFAQRTIHEDLLKFEPTESKQAGSVEQFNPTVGGGALSAVKRTVASFIKAIRDNTAYDIPSNAACALQNSYLIPLYKKATQIQPLSLTERTAFFNGLLEADTDIAQRLAVTRATNDARPMYGNYMPYLY